MTSRPSWTAKQRAEIFRDADGICHICKRRIAPGEPWHVEHPKARGFNGSDKQSDMHPAHIDCHAGKTKREVKAMRKADRSLKASLGMKRKTAKMKSRNTFRQYEPRVKQIFEDFDT